MTDGHDDDERTTPEGVRILGAEEARAAVEGGRARPADLDPPPRRSPRPERPEPRWAPPEATASDDLDGLDALGREPSVPRFPDDGPTWSAAPVAPGDDEIEILDEGLDAYVVEDEGPRVSTGEVPALQHWTEPPTGAVPAIFAGDEPTPATGDPDDLDAWAALGGSRRFRAEGSDWSDADFGERDLGDTDLQVGALGSPAGPDTDDDAFAQEVAARRRPRPTTPSAAAPPRARRSRPAPAPTTPAAPGEEIFPESTGRDLPTALATAAIMVVLALVCFSWGRGATAWLAAAVAGMSSLELSWELRRKGLRPATPIVLLGSVGLVVSAYQYGVPAYPLFTGLVVVFTMVWFLWRVTPGRPTAGVASTLLAFAWVGGLAGFAGLLLQARDGVGILLGAAICVIASDVAGFFVGSQFGKSPIAPSVSPNKTVEGTVAGMFASLVAGWLIAGMIEPWDATSGLALGALVAVGALLGDLSESMLKRDLGVKDFGSVLPGHGGVLDRFDSLLFCLPIAYYLALHLDFV